MKARKSFVPFSAIVWILTLLLGNKAVAWDYEGHYVINELALASLPTNFPAFVLTPATENGLKPKTMLGKIRPAEHVGNPAQTNGIFSVVLAYILEQNAFGRTALST